MVEIVVTVKDNASPALASVRDALRPERLLPVLGRSVTNAVRAHFDELESSRPNKLGGERQHYYSGARAGTSFVVDGDSAIVTVHQVGMRMRYYGGTVSAGAGTSFKTGQPTKYLTIPVTPESYGHRAADFEGLKVLWGANGPWALARVEEGSKIKGAGTDTSTSEVLFILKKSVDIPADATMLPDPSALSDAVQEDFDKYVSMAWRRAA